MFCITIEQKSSCYTFILTYCKNISNFENAKFKNQNQRKTLKMDFYNFLSFRILEVLTLER